MFEEKQVVKIIELHQKSYRLFQWLNHAIADGAVSFSTAHVAMDMASASQAWLEKNYLSIPSDARPEKADLAAFSHLFASYLTTSFELMDKPVAVKQSSHACGCYWCDWVIKIRSFKPRKITDNAKATARELKRLYLLRLSKEISGTEDNAVAERLLEDDSLQKSLAMVTYVGELLRRTEFAGQGPGVVALWRIIAWEKGSPNKKFKLKASDVMLAEKKVIEQLKAE